MLRPIRSILNLFQSSFATHKYNSHRRHWSSVKLSLETLEERLAPANLLVSVLGGNTVVAGKPFLFTAQALDPQGDPVGNYSGPSSATITANPSDPLVSLPITGLMNRLGSGYFLGEFKTAGSYTLTATAGSYSGMSPSITVMPARAIYFTVSVPGTATTGKPFNLTVNALDAFGNVASGYQGLVHFTSSDAGALLPADCTLADGVAIVSATLNTSGNQTVTATDSISVVPTIAGTSAAITARGLTVTSFTPTATGFTATFSKPFLATDLTLYGAGFQTVQDVILAGANVGRINGSLLIDPSNTSITFHATANFLSLLNGFTSVVLPDDTYTVTLISGSGGNGFVDALGAGLDGANDGGHADYSATFTTHYQADAAPVLAIPDFARGPFSNQVIKVPNDSRWGIPITLYNVAGVTDVRFTLNYNPTLLTVSGASTDDATDPAGSFTLVGTPTILDAAHATADFHFNDGFAFTGTLILGDIVATVPNIAANSYKAKDLLRLSSITFNGAVFTGASADGLDVDAYFGDVTGNGRIDGLDVATASNLAQGADAGFPAYPLLDPAIIGDVALDYAVDAGDVSDLAAYVSRIPVPVIPAFFPDSAITPVGPDPTLRLGQPRTSGGTETGRSGDKETHTGSSSHSLLVSLSPGLAFTVPIFLDQPHPAGSTGMTEALLGLTYDSTILGVSSSDIVLGSLPGSTAGWQLTSVVDQATGQIGIALYGTTPIAATQQGSLVVITFHVLPDVTVPTTTVELVRQATAGGDVFATQVDDTQGRCVTELSHAVVFLSATPERMWRTCGSFSTKTQERAG
jgi:hypothetical protein